MKKLIFRKEFLVSLFLVFLLTILALQFDIFMPMGMTMVLIILIVTSLFAYFALIWKESPQDEREANHIDKAGRLSFFSGTVILTMAIICQSLSHNIDPWLVVALIIMILAKLFVRLYLEDNN